MLEKELERKYSEHIEEIYIEESKSEIFLRQITVKRSSRNKGIGKLILNDLKQVGKPIFLYINPANSSHARKLRHFYTSSGFIRTGTAPESRKTLTDLEWFKYEHGKN